MRPERNSKLLLGVARAKAKMFEYGIIEREHIEIKQDPAELFIISIALLGDLAIAINQGEEGIDSEAELRANLLFSAQFFDSYHHSKLNDAFAPYLILLGSASYYLCGYPGSASVLAKRIKDNRLNLEAGGLENLLLYLLQVESKHMFDEFEGDYGKLISKISKSFMKFVMNGEDEDKLLGLVEELRKTVYESGSPRELLFGDVIAAVLRKKLVNSTWNALPKYSDLPRGKWLSALTKDSFIKELWPAQHLLGKKGVFQGKSAVVQMPTSAGKTKATELIIRSAFLAERTKLVVIIAPFRALCHEIQNDLSDAFEGETVLVDALSDVLQPDFAIDEFLERKKILIVTPEKLLYVLRQSPEIADNVGMLIFDEGHQFDSGTRGITYELLLTSLLSILPDDVQKILISAVISNAESIGEWLNVEQNIVKETKEISLNPTFRSIGFASWTDQLGRIEYVESHNVEKNEFFVPRVIKQLNLSKRDRERKNRVFPKKGDTKTIALYLGLKLMQEGGVAIFCGRKDTAAGIYEEAADIIDRGLPMALPKEFSDEVEVERLTSLHCMNLGGNVSSSQSAAYGFFFHHGNMPHGIRLAVEHATREDLVRFVVCTSTLAQGVNLPIRYLIVAGISQGRETMKVRDFQNLIGRAGRAGLHTEGSVLFADPNVYDKRNSRSENSGWKKVKSLLAIGNQEHSTSNLLSIFDPIKIDIEKAIMNEPFDFAMAYISNSKRIYELVTQMGMHCGSPNFSQDAVENQVTRKINLITAVESFLLSHWDETEVLFTEKDVINLAEKTLAYYLADEQKKDYIRKLFLLLAENISDKIKKPEKRKIYGKTLYGIQKAMAIEKWVNENANQLFSVIDEAEALDLVWPLFEEHINKGVFTKFDPHEFRKELIHEWIKGEPYYALLNTINDGNVKKIRGKGRVEFTIDDIVNVCEGVLGYEGTMLLGAVCGFVEALNPVAIANIVRVLQRLQKRIKYGLPTVTTVALYELGFSDRVIAQDIAASMQLMATSSKTELEGILRHRKDEALAVMEKYPSYFQERMRKLVE